jgi:hypothetical protein
MKLNYNKAIPDDVLQKLPAKAVRFRVEPVFVYRGWRTSQGLVDQMQIAFRLLRNGPRPEG